MNVSVNGKTVTITFNTDEDGGPSGSGKSRIVASTGGNQVIPGTDGVVLGLNAYRKNK